MCAGLAHLRGYWRHARRNRIRPDQLHQLPRPTSTSCSGSLWASAMGLATPRRFRLGPSGFLTSVVSSLGLMVAGYGGGSAHRHTCGECVDRRSRLADDVSDPGGGALPDVHGWHVVSEEPAGRLQARGLDSDTRAPERSERDIHDTAKCWAVPGFYFLWVAYCLGTTAGLMTISQLVPFATSAGKAAGSCRAVRCGIGSASGRILSGWMSDHGRSADDAPRIMIFVSATRDACTVHLARAGDPFLPPRRGRLLVFRRTALGVCHDVGRLLRHQVPGTQLRSAVHSIRRGRSARSAHRRVRVFDAFDDYRYAFFIAAGLSVGGPCVDLDGAPAAARVDRLSDQAGRVGGYFFLRHAVQETLQVWSIVGDALTLVGENGAGETSAHHVHLGVSVA